MRLSLFCTIAAIGLAATSSTYASSEQYEYSSAPQPLSARPSLNDTGSEGGPISNGIATLTQSNAAAPSRSGGSSAYQDYAGQSIRGDGTRQIGGEGTPGAGANGLYTGRQAQARIVNAGFTRVTAVTKDFRANWRGQATKNGLVYRVSVDYRGDVTSAVSRTQ